ncbi:MAG: lamin tail domain-containing protein [Patescibacteria group bacterium]
MKNIFIIFLLVFSFCPPLILAADLSARADKVEINTASLAQLDEIIGIGPVLAQRIIEARPFLSVDDLIKVKGIGEKTLQKIKDQGLAYVGEKSEIQNSKSETNPNSQNLNTQNTTEATRAIIYPSGIFINEILPSPEGADETNEWIELYNANNFEVDLSNWQIKDTAGTITAFTISKYLPEGRQVKISANGYLVFKRQDTKIILNNDGDGLNLLTPDGKTIDLVSLTKAPLGQSYNKTNNGLPAQAGWQWSKTLTPGTANIIVLEILSNSKKSGNSNKVDENLKTASINDAISQTANESFSGANPWFLFLTALIITIISAAIVLLIKLKLFKKYVGT